MNTDTTLSQSSSFSLAKVFGWLFLALGITAASAYGFFALINTGIISPQAYLIVMAVAIVAMFIETIVIQLRVIRSNKSLIVPYIIYALSMGLLMSSIVLVVDSIYVITSFGVSAALFGVMALYGYLTKRDLSRMASMSFTVLLGAIIVSVINIIAGSTTIDWIISFVTFGVIMLFVSVDMWRIRRIADSGMASQNICLYCAFQLYIDFIYIFMRVLQFVIMFARDR